MPSFFYVSRGKVGVGVLGGRGAQSGCLVKQSEIANSKSGLRNNLILRGNISSINLHSTGSLQQGMQQVPWLKVSHFASVRSRKIAYKIASLKSTYISSRQKGVKYWSQCNHSPINEHRLETSKFALHSQQPLGLHRFEKWRQPNKKTRLSR